jgi:hypothetical protein
MSFPRIRNCGATFDMPERIGHNPDREQGQTAR